MRRCLLLSAGVFLLFTFSAYAQQKVGFIDIDVVLRESKAGKEANASFQKDAESKQLILEQKKKAVESMAKDLLENGSVMSGEKRRSLAERIEKQEKDLKRTREDFAVELKRKELELTQNLLKEVEVIVMKIGQEKGFDIVVEKTTAGILYGAPGTDVTQDVITAYDASR